MATAAQKVAALEAKLDALMAAVAPDADEDTTEAKPKAKKAPKANVRNLDPILVACGSREFRVAAAGERPYTAGARVTPVAGTKKNGETKYGASFTRADIVAIAEHSDEIQRAITTVDKRAKLGKHAVKADAS